MLYQLSYSSVVVVMMVPIGCAEAGRGNRTLVFSLEGYCSTIELHPRRTASVSAPGGPAGRAFAGDETGECRIRTCEGIIHQIYSLTPLTARETPRMRAAVGMRCGGCVVVSVRRSFVGVGSVVWGVPQGLHAAAVLVG